MLGNHRMVTVATRIEPDELGHLKTLAEECGLSVCGYLRDLIRLELARAKRATENSLQAPAVNGQTPVTDLVQ
jgi:hypothetical protein